MRSTCRHCFGSCMLIKTPCVECQGKGKTVQRKRVIVPVPAGRTFAFPTQGVLHVMMRN